MSKSQPRRKTSPTKKPPARKTATRKLTHESQPELINRLPIPERISGLNYPLLQVDRAGEYFYAADVKGVAIGAPVEWVKGILLDPNESVPNTPPDRHQVVDATIDPIKRDTLETAYSFPRNRLGPVEPGSVVRLATWVKFRSGQVVMADNLSSYQTMRCGNIRPKIESLTAGAKVVVTSNTVKVRVTCNAPFQNLTGKFYTSKPSIDCKPDTQDPVSSVDFQTGATDATISVAGWTQGVKNWLVVWARAMGTTNFNQCINSPMELTE